ncbi:adenylate/guanylate cyclase domain-containing protein [Mycobacterium sp. 852002-51057_SCH5723018]|uniref:adenylate/guanylate cyclase domain-containing protein n=1 Tax=Mycobacterium sp. 852002-51057_SCH5723018 TaxID=1834094 RepID=UPI000A5AB8CD|nr:adenylate/guanylate cyclase domain-containing protein [Mycobacterium sp. 852002-51057_SCH5723018]
MGFSVRAAASRPGSRLRTANWLMHMALPMLALWLLLGEPKVDLEWDNRAAHFVLVLSAALVSVVLGALIGRAARARDDARLWLVSLVFVTTAGFFAVHALFTPDVLMDTSDAEFMLPTRMGLVLAGAVALASAITFTPARSARLWSLRRPLLILLGALMASCAVAILSGVLDRLQDQELVEGTEQVAALIGGALFAVATVAYFPIYRRRPAVVVMSVLTAFMLLAEASVALAFGMSWHASWWLWHVLMTIAFCFIAYSARVQFHKQGTARGLFDSLATQQTIADLRRDYAAALEATVDMLQRRERGEKVAPGAVTARLADRFELSEQQVAVLKRGAEALGAERERVRKLRRLVAVGQESSVIQDEDALLQRVMAAIADAFPGDRFRLGLLRSGEVSFANDEACQRAPSGSLVLSLMVKGQVAGAIEAHRPDGSFTDADVALLRSFTMQCSIALENARLYRHLDGLFRSYMSPAVATALLADPDQAGLGGAIAEVTVLMADLHGFTPFTEATSPDQVVTMLNTYYGAVVPAILETGGTVLQFLGDGVIAIWGAPVRQHDHALRAARAGLALHAVVEEAAVGHPDWPRFRVGINTGPALVGNVGAPEMRNFTAIGDTINVAARLENLAQPGQVVLGPTTAAALGAAARVSQHCWAKVKGKRDLVRVCVLNGLAN